MKMSSTGGHVILSGLSQESREAFAYAQEQCEAVGFEILAPLIGYPDERVEITEVVNKALHEWRESKGGELPAGVDPIQPEEPAAFAPGEYVETFDAIRQSPEEVEQHEHEAREREEQARAEEEAAAVEPEQTQLQVGETA